MNHRLFSEGKSRNIVFLHEAIGIKCTTTAAHLMWLTRIEWMAPTQSIVVLRFSRQRRTTLKKRSIWYDFTQKVDSLDRVAVMDVANYTGLS